MRLSEHFWLSEFLRSETAERHGIDMTPPEWVIGNLERLCQVYMEPARFLLDGEAITPSSGYRPPELNCLIGGAMTRESLKAVLDSTQIEAVGMAARRRLARANYDTNDSAHQRGLAVDWHHATLSPYQCVHRLLDADFEFDQLIYELSWVHSAIAGSGETPRREVLTAQFQPNGRARYMPGLVG